MLEPTQQARMINLAEALIEHERDLDTRAALVKAVAKDGSSLGSVVRFIAWLEPESGEPRILSEDALKAAINILLIVYFTSLTHRWRFLMS